MARQNNKTYYERRKQGIPYDIAHMSEEKVREYKDYKAMFNDEKIARILVTEKLQKRGAKFTTQQINKIIKEFEEEAKFMKGEVAGKFIKEEKQYLRQLFKEGDIKRFKKLATKGAFNYQARREMFDKWEEDPKQAPRWLRNAMKKESDLLSNKKFGSGRITESGIESVREMFTSGKTKEEARTIVRLKQARGEINDKSPKHDWE